MKLKKIILSAITLTSLLLYLNTDIFNSKDIKIGNLFDIDAVIKNPKRNIDLKSDVTTDVVYLEKCIDGDSVTRFLISM